MYSQNQWIQQPTPVTAYMHRLFFVDTLNGWAAGDSGKIIRTTNGGTNWVLQNTGINYYVDDIFFINANTGWALANDFYYFGTTILRTTNGGTNWTFSRYPDTTSVLFTVFFHNANTGYLAGYGGEILKTTNGGNNWTRCSVDSTFFSYFQIRKITFFNERIGAACGGAIDIQGVIWLTTNFGLNWTPYSVAGEPIFKVKFKDSLNIAGAGGDFEYGAIFVTTSNGGINWNYNSLEIFGAGYGFDNRTPNEYWMALGFSETFAVSTNGGFNWYEAPTPDSTAMYDILFKSQTAGWCCGVDGKVYKYNPAFIGIEPINNNIPESFELSQNYPNPFNPSTKIKFGVPNQNGSNVKLIVYDVLGREIKTLVNQQMKAGTYEITFNAGNFSSGIYYYRLESGNFREMKKMVILK